MQRPNPEGVIEEISLEIDRPKRTIKIRADLGENIKVNLISLLHDNAHIFTFSKEEMSGIDRAFVVHRRGS